MARLEETIVVRCGAETAFDYVADFATTAEWDPGIVEARGMTEGPVGVGSRFEVLAEFNGRRMPLVYEITVYERPARVVLVGEGDRFHGVDEITFAPNPDGGTGISYRADIRLKGLARLAEPFLGGKFDRMGKAAVAGLKAKLDARAGP